MRDQIVDGIAQAKAAVAELLVPVAHEAKTGRSKTSTPIYAPAVTRQALVELKTRTVMTTGDTVIVQTGPVTFLENIVIGNEDRLTLPDGTVGVVASVDGQLDPKGGRYMAVVWIGRP